MENRPCDVSSSVDIIKGGAGHYGCLAWSLALAAWVYSCIAPVAREAAALDSCVVDTPAPSVLTALLWVRVV